MKPVVATFAEAAGASSAAAKLRARFGLPASDVSIAIAAAYGESYDGHALLVAWIADEVEEPVRVALVDSGGALQPQPWTARKSITTPS